MYGLEQTDGEVKGKGEGKEKEREREREMRMGKAGRLQQYTR